MSVSGANSLPPFLKEGDKVIYSDGKTHGSIYWTYFCPYCQTLKDHRLLSCELEAKHCTNCGENVASADSERNLRCQQCFECPTCFQILAPRFDSVKSADGTDGRNYYLACQFCRWTTRSAGIPDKLNPPTHASPWTFSADENTQLKNEIVALTDYFRALGIQDERSLLLQSKDPKHLKRPRINYTSILTDKYKLVSVAAQKKAGLNPVQTDLSLLAAKLQPVQHHVALAEPSDEDFLMDVSKQRLAMTSSFAQKVQSPGDGRPIYPQNKHLTCRKTWRCKECQHIMIRPEYGAFATKYKINQLAFNFVPLIKPVKPNLSIGKVADFVLTISNPLSEKLTISFSPIGDEEPLPAWAKGEPVKDLTLPQRPVFVSGRSALAEEAPVEGPVEDDPKLIAFRKLHTIGIRASCVPISKDVDNWASFNIKYNFTNIATKYTESKSEEGKGDAKDVSVSWVELRVDMNLGKAT